MFPLKLLESSFQVHTLFLYLERRSLAVYEARNSGIHKPQFYQWLSGDLSARSETLSVSSLRRNLQYPEIRDPDFSPTSTMVESRSTT
jgi:hypothetical protein